MDKQVELLMASQMPLMVELFTLETPKGFTAQQFKVSIHSLLEVLGDSNPFFIRCLKPNQTKLPLDYDFRVVGNQLGSLSIIDALQLAQKGYPARYEYAKFLEVYHLLTMIYHPTGADETEQVNSMLSALGDITPADYQKGSTMVFLKKITARYLDSERSKIARGGGTVVEDLIRLSAPQRIRQAYDVEKSRLLKIQAHARGYRERLVIMKNRRRRQALWGATMWTYYVKQFKRDRLAAFTFQTAIRELLAFVRIDEMRTEARTNASKERIGVY